MEIFFGTIFVFCAGGLTAKFLFEVDKNKQKFKPYNRIRDLAVDVSKLEGKKVNLPIAQINEVLKCINKVTNKKFYKFVKRGY